MTSEPEQPRQRSRWPRNPVLCLATALAAFFATAALIRDRLPLPRGLLDAKLEAFEADEAFTTAYIGSSLVHRHIVPEVIDGHLQEQGVTSRSYNFGAPRMSWPEAVRVADRLIATAPPSLRTVVVEVHLFVPTSRNEETARYLAWHTLPETYWSVLRLLEEEPPGEPRRQHIESELRAFGKRVAAVGRLSGAFRGLWDERTGSEDAVPLDPDAQGYEPVEDEATGAAAARQRRFARRKKAFERDVERASNGRRTEPLSPYAATMLYRLVTRLRGAGFDVIVLEMPHINRPKLTVPAPIEAEAAVLSFYDPRLYAELYDPALHYDRVHLRDEGARVFSTMLGRRLARLFRRDQRD